MRMPRGCTRAIPVNAQKQAHLWALNNEREITAELRRLADRYPIG